METLILTQGYLPFDRISWQRAVTLWFLDKVEILEEYEDREIRSTSFAIKMPAVVRLVHRVRTHLRGYRLSRDNLFARDKGRCQYCAVRLSRSTATWDHVVPRRGGGRTSWDNIVLACVACNQRKGGRTPAQAQMVLRAAPRAPRALPPTLRFAVNEGKQLPVSWRQYLFDLTYWHTELEPE